jgi:DNA-binding Lrp family transcriptional regulator
VIAAGNTPPPTTVSTACPAARPLNRSIPLNHPLGTLSQQINCSEAWAVRRLARRTREGSLRRCTNQLSYYRRPAALKKGPQAAFESRRELHSCGSVCCVLSKTPHKSQTQL